MASPMSDSETTMGLLGGLSLGFLIELSSEPFF